MQKLTDKAKIALQWFSDHEGIAALPVADIHTPSWMMRQRLIKIGLIELRSAGNMQFMTHHITDAGREALNG